MNVLSKISLLCPSASPRLSRVQHWGTLIVICVSIQEKIFSEHVSLPFINISLSLKGTLPRTCIPPKDPHFIGRAKECEEIIGHVTSETTRMVSIWGPPGFGKTSVAVAVGHELQSVGLPVFFFSLRGLQSKVELTAELLSIFRETATSQVPPCLSADDELLQRLSAISDRIVLILDNADELLESEVPNAKEDVINFFQEVLSQTEQLTFVVIKRASFHFMNFQSHQAVRIDSMDESSSQKLVRQLIPDATTSVCTEIAHTCGHVPLLIKVLCSIISEDNVQQSRFLDDGWAKGRSFSKMLDNSKDPTHQKMDCLLDEVFQKLSTKAKKAVVSLSVLPPKYFDVTVAAAIMGITRILDAKKMLHYLQSKSLLESSSKSGSFSMHKLVRSFAKEKGEKELKETLTTSEARFHEFYISLFEMLNEQFLTGNSLKAVITFYEDEESIVRSLTLGPSDSRTANAVFKVLVKAELFFHSLYWSDGGNVVKIYDSAMKAAKTLGEEEIHRQLLVSLAFNEVTLGPRGRAMQLLSEAKELQMASLSTPVRDKAKLLSYLGNYQLVIGKTEEGVQCLQEALPLMERNLEKTILRLTMFQILERSRWNCLVQNTQVKPTVIIHWGFSSLPYRTFVQLFSPSSVHLASE